MFSRFCFLLSDIASDFLISHQWQRQRQVKTAYLAHLIGPIFRLVLIWCKFCFLSLEIPCPEIWLAILGATYCSKCSSLRQTFLTSFPPSLYPNYTLRFNITFKPQNKQENKLNGFMKPFMAFLDDSTDRKKCQHKFWILSFALFWA